MPAPLFPVGPVLLEGRLVRLEPLAGHHADGLLAAATAAPEEGFPFTFVPGDRGALARWLEEALAAAAEGRAIPFATCAADDGQVLGATRFGNLERWPRTPDVPGPPPTPSGLDAVEIGWTWLARSAQRSGANTEAKRLMLGHAFEAWGVRRVTLKTDARNQRSRAAIARLGATLDGVLRAHLPARDGGVRDSAVFSILAAEWPAVRRRLDGLLAR
jgi:RimJ/RimL family protein N-acetyltransferase